MNAAAKYGVVIEQSHALANFYPRAPKEWFVKMLDRCAEAAVRMQIKDLVFHADEYYPAKGEPFDTDAALIQVCDVLAPSVEKLVKGGVRAAMETVFEDHYGVPKDQRSHFCGDIEELAAVIDRFNDPMVGCCWDFGHARIGVGDKNHADMIRRFGKKIFCTHVHDNVGYLRTDLHLPPFMGDINWEDVMPALKDAGYEGSLTFELAYGSFPDDKVTEYAKELYHIGEILTGMFDKTTGGENIG